MRKAIGIYGDLMIYYPGTAEVSRSLQNMVNFGIDLES